jgi:AcrR family transcriptional regulator
MPRPSKRIASQLPRGRHQLSRRFVVHNQRERLFEAIVRTVAEEGYVETSVEAVLQRAGVSRRTFYDQFSGKEDCFLQAYDAVLAQLMAVVTEAYGGSGPWPERVRAGLSALLEFLASEDAVARVAMIEVLAAGPRAIARYSEALEGFVPFLDEGREASRQGAQLPPGTAHAVIGGLASVIHRRLLDGKADELPSLLPDLLYFTLVPYLGHARAARYAYQD